MIPSFQDQARMLLPVNRIAAAYFVVFTTLAVVMARGDMDMIFSGPILWIGAMASILFASWVTPFLSEWTSDT